TGSKPCSLAWAIQPSQHPHPAVLNTSATPARAPEEDKTTMVAVSVVLFRIIVVSSVCGVAIGGFGLNRLRDRRGVEDRRLLWSLHDQLADQAAGRPRQGVIHQHELAGHLERQIDHGAAPGRHRN